MKLSGLIAFCKSHVIQSGKNKQFSKAAWLAVLCVPLSLHLCWPLQCGPDTSFPSTALLHCLSFTQHGWKRCSRHINLTWEAPPESYLWNDYLNWFCSGQIISPKGNFFSSGTTAISKELLELKHTSTVSVNRQKIDDQFIFFSTNCPSDIKPQTWQQHTENSTSIAMCCNRASCFSGLEIWVLYQALPLKILFKGH